MPKFTITEHGNFFADKNNIWVSKNFRTVFSVTESACPQLQFYFGVFIFYCLHILPSLFGSMIIHYSSPAIQILTTIMYNKTDCLRTLILTRHFITLMRKIQLPNTLYFAALNLQAHSNSSMIYPLTTVGV